MNKILCATDGTIVSEQAEIWSGRLAKRLGCELIYLYVSGVSPDDLTSTVGDMVILDAVEARNHEFLSRCEKDIKKQGLEAKCIVLNRHEIAKGIVEFADAEGFDHIVTGTKHIGSIPGVFLGSIASEVIHRAHCAVTVIRADIIKKTSTY